MGSVLDAIGYVGVPQPNIAFWERSEKPPRSDVLSKRPIRVNIQERIVYRISIPIPLLGLTEVIRACNQPN